MYAAIDNFGNSYVSLSQANTSGNTMMLFIYKLVEILDSKDPNWRSNSIITFDNASYHSATTTMKIMKELNLPVLFWGHTGIWCNQ